MDPSRCMSIEGSSMEKMLLVMTGIEANNLHVLSCAFYLRKLVLYWTKLVLTNETIILALQVLFAKQSNFRGDQA